MDTNQQKPNEEIAAALNKLPQPPCPFCHRPRPSAAELNLKAALDEITLLRGASPTPANRQLLADCLKSFSAQLEAAQDEIPGDILEVLGPEDRRAALLSFCNLVALGMLQTRPGACEPDVRVIVKAPSRIIRLK